MTEPDVRVVALRKVFQVPEREAGLRSSIRSLVRRTHREVVAVRGIDFAVQPGEIVGFLGPNGAGKTTTLKMLSGLLHPTSGQARVLGHVPWRRERDLLRRITLVMGNRNQLQWDLPALDSYEMNRAVYRLDATAFRRTRDELVELLEIGDLVRKPVRNLSLGERMKAEIVGALLHLPQVLFLDEPTIGLDLTMQKRIRSFVAEYNRRYGATVLLTSHYMADVQALCPRVVVISSGSVLYDGELAALSQATSLDQTLTVTLAEPELAPSVTCLVGGDGQVVDVAGAKVVLRVRRSRTSRTAARLLSELDVVELTIEDPSIEDVIERAFTGTA